MPILPLPQFEADLAEHLRDEADREAYARLNAPKTLVVRFGYLKMVGEFPWQSTEKPGCGSKVVVRTHRGTEIGEMLTSTCPNSGCSKSVSRKEMLEYIENSGGRQYPFSTDGRALRIATPDDLGRQSALEQSKHALRTAAKRRVEEMRLPMKIVEAEPILGDERLTIYFTSEDRVDFRDLVQALQTEMHARIDMRQVGARDEARVVADYERCGQYCCCKNFLKVLKPVSMKSAKIQKATLDPLKISGRCGRLMCCLRYEDETYENLRSRLPHRKSRVGTPDGDGEVVNTQILTQLALVRLDSGTEVAVPVENLTAPSSPTPLTPAPPQRPAPPTRTNRPQRPERTPRPARTPPPGPQPETGAERPGRAEAPDITEIPGDEPSNAPPGGPKKKRRRRKRNPGSVEGGGSEGGAGVAPEGGQAASAPVDQGTDAREPTPYTDDAPASSGDGTPDDGPRKKRRRRRRRPGAGGDPSAGSGDAPKPDSPDAGSGDRGDPGD